MPEERESRSPRRKKQNTLWCSGLNTNTITVAAVQTQQVSDRNMEHDEG